ncbi:hypothetical protein COLO4_13786 [Corchorus olitorius]|uniref:KIB1-4 beta-propeller domain-containing protein n=1 Tax=Corchorus olitorius TaxID=93759 RepID=A0A1R3JV19_9ROSI|nr:hypothetical protein COLO4_13786 [Corchorus olitorius]
MSFRSVTSNKVHHRQLPAAEFAGQSKTICGSSAGFLIMMDEISEEITMIDPISKTQFRVPPLSSTDSLDDNVVLKAVLSAPPDCNPYGFVLMAIYGEKRELAYYKAGSKTWTKLDEAGSYFDDVLWYKGDFYAVNEYGKVLLVCQPGSDSDSDSDPNPLMVGEIAPPWLLRGSKVYLVVMAGYLCAIVRFLKDSPNPTLGYETRKFELFMVDEFRNWTRFGKANDWAFFLGQNESKALSVEDFKELKGSCIYFTDDNWESYKFGIAGGHDSGVFDMAEECFQPLQSSHQDWQNPVWFLPDDDV